MLWVGLAIVIVTFWLIYKNYEARLCSRFRVS